MALNLTAVIVDSGERFNCCVKGGLVACGGVAMLRDVADNDRILGQGFVDRLSFVSRRRLTVGLALLVVGLTAVVGYNYSRATPEGPSSDAGVQEIVVPADACADPDVYEAAVGALAQPAESPANSLLALPSEVDARDRATQERAWREIDDSKRAFQLCLRLMQEQVPTNP